MEAHAPRRAASRQVYGRCLSRSFSSIWTGCFWAGLLSRSRRVLWAWVWSGCGWLREDREPPPTPPRRRAKAEAVHDLESLGDEGARRLLLAAAAVVVLVFLRLGALPAAAERECFWFGGVEEDEAAAPRAEVSPRFKSPSAAIRSEELQRTKLQLGAVDLSWNAAHLRSWYEEWRSEKRKKRKREWGRKKKNRERKTRSNRCLGGVRKL